MPAPTVPRSWRESWPPTQMRLHRSIEAEGTKMHREPDLSGSTLVDDDPLAFFLDPAPLLDGGDLDEDMDMMDFDAGIEDATHPAPIVRSVSPSSLEGLGRPPAARPPTPPRSPPSRNSPEVDTPDYEDDGEDYIRFGKPAFSLPFSLREFATTAKREKERRDKALAADMMLLSPTTSFSVPRPTASRGRPVTRPGLGRRTHSWSSRSSPHAWREPSPDVWSIEEEPEDEPMSDAGAAMDDNTKPLDIPAAKPKKRVRFAFPVREEIP